MDKTYFMGLLNTQLADLNEEIESLEKELVKFESEQQKLLFYEQRFVNFPIFCFLSKWNFFNSCFFLEFGSILQNST